MQNGRAIWLISDQLEEEVTVNLFLSALDQLTEEGVRKFIVRNILVNPNREIVSDFLELTTAHINQYLTQHTEGN